MPVSSVAHVLRHAHARISVFVARVRMSRASFMFFNTPTPIFLFLESL